MSNLDKLKQLYNKANSLNEDIPVQIIEKMSTYGSIYELLGGLHANSVGDWKMKEAIRRETIASVFSLDPEGTIKDRENKAEMAAAQARKDEAIAEAEATRWKNAKDAVAEQINIMKIKLKDMKDVANGQV